jgi:(p)ppGpp synthase/HD superfamily hydrolase
MTDAFDYARALHGKQARKGTTVPYIGHLLAVTALVIEHRGDEDQAVAALLHDAIEDQGRGGRTRDEIEAKFG